MQKGTICLEVYVNGKFFCRAGDDEAYSVHTGLAYIKGADWLNLRVSGLVQSEEYLQEVVTWLQNTILNVGDELTIKIVKSDEPTAYGVDKRYGTPIEEGRDAFFCNFCGKQASDDNSMLIHQSRSNICHDCLRKYNPDKER